VIPFLIGLGGFIIFVSIEILYQLSDLIVKHRVGIEKLFLLLYYYLPYFIAMGVPVGVLLSIFWTFSKLSEDRELMAIQVHGVSQKNLIVPFLLLSIFLSVGVFFLNDQVVPIYQSKAEEAMSRYVLRKPEVFVVENVISKIGEDQYFYVEKYDEKTNTLWNVVIFKYGSEEKIVTAKKVQKRKNRWYLFDGRYYTIDKDGFLKLDVHFSEMELDITEDIENLLRVGKTPKEMTGKELKEKIEFFKKVGIKPSPWIVELQGRYANSLTPIVIVLVGVPLSLLFQLRSKSWGVIFTFVLVVLYQGSGAWLSAMGKENLLDPGLAPWIPNLVFSAVGSILFFLLDTALAYRIREFLTKLFVVVMVLLATSLFSSQVSITADKMVRFPDRIIFKGNVEILYKDASIEASQAIVYIEGGKTKEIEALGDVLYRRKETLLESTRLIFRTESEQNVLFHVRGSTKIELEGKKKQIYLSGESLSTKGTKTLVNKGYVTTCSSIPPHYKLKAFYIEIVENEYLLARDVVFYLLEIPLFYQPIFFSSLSDKPQPFSVEVGFNPSFFLKTTYSISYREGNVLFSVKRAMKEDTWKDFKWNHKIRNWSVDFNYEESNNSRKISARLFDQKNTLFFSQESSEKIYQFEHKEKIFGGSVDVLLRKRSTESENEYIAPKITARKLSFKTDVGTLHVYSFNHETRMEESIETTGVLSSRFRSKPFLSFQSVSFDLSGKYRFEGGEFNRNTSFLKLDSIWDFKNISLGNFSRLDDKIYAGIYRSSENGYRLGNFFTTTLKIPIGPLSLESYYKLYTIQGKNLRKFPQNKAQNELDLKISLSFGSFRSSLETTYDFLEEEFSDPYLKTSFSLKTGKLIHTVNTTTRLSLENSAESYTRWEFQQRVGALLNKLYFTYHYKEPHIQYAEDQMRIYGSKFFYMENPRITAYSKVKVNPIKLERFWIRGSFEKGKSMHSVKAEFSGDTLEFSYRMKNSDPTFSISFELEKWNAKSFSLSIEKSLHCLGAKMSASFGENFSLESFSVFFYIRDFPNSGIGFDSEGGLGVNVF